MGKTYEEFCKDVDARMHKRLEGVENPKAREQIIKKYEELKKMHFYYLCTQQSFG